MSTPREYWPDKTPTNALNNSGITAASMFTLRDVKNYSPKCVAVDVAEFGSIDVAAKALHNSTKRSFVLSPSDTRTHSSTGTRESFAAISTSRPIRSPCPPTAPLFCSGSATLLSLCEDEDDVAREFAMYRPFSPAARMGFVWDEVEETGEEQDVSRGDRSLDLDQLGFLDTDSPAHKTAVAEEINRRGRVRQRQQQGGGGGTVANGLRSLSLSAFHRSPFHPATSENNRGNGGTRKINRSNGGAKWQQRRVSTPTRALACIGDGRPSFLCSTGGPKQKQKTPRTLRSRSHFGRSLENLVFGGI
jgi:hypothetical protein